MTVSTKKINQNSSAEAMPANFEVAYAELEALVAGMESGDMILDDALKAYRRGHTLLQFCQQVLGEVEQAVQLLNAKNSLEQFMPTNE